jgi:hypothetical protein
MYEYKSVIMSKYPLLIPPPPQYDPESLDGYLLQNERDRINAERAKFAMDILIKEYPDIRERDFEHVKHELLVLESCYTDWFFSRNPSSTANYEMAILKVLQSLK